MATPTTTNESKNVNTQGVGAGTKSMGTSAGQRPSSINDALKTLDDAIKSDGANLTDLLTSEYQNLRNAIQDMSPKVGERMREYGTQTMDTVQGYASQGIERGREIADQVDVSVRENPWPVIGGVAVGSLALGFILGRNRSSQTMGSAPISR